MRTGRAGQAIASVVSCCPLALSCRNRRSITPARSRHDRRLARSAVRSGGRSQSPDGCVPPGARPSLPRGVDFGTAAISSFRARRRTGRRRRSSPGVRATLSHSARSAITGSILVARRAGNHDAHSVTSRRKIDSAT
jgi:hypothetical protein